MQEDVYDDAEAAAEIFVRRALAGLEKFMPTPPEMQEMMLRLPHSDFERLSHELISTAGAMIDEVVQTTKNAEAAERIVSFLCQLASAFILAVMKERRGTPHQPERFSVTAFSTYNQVVDLLHGVGRPEIASIIEEMRVDEAYVLGGESPYKKCPNPDCEDGFVPSMHDIRACETCDGSGNVRKGAPDAASA